MAGATIFVSGMFAGAALAFLVLAALAWLMVKADDLRRGEDTDG